MAYGSVNVPGVNGPEFERAWNEIKVAAVAGDISVSLCTEAGEDIVTEKDDQLLANRRFEDSGILRREIAAAVAGHDNSQSSHPNYLIAN